MGFEGSKAYKLYRKTREKFWPLAAGYIAVKGRGLKRVKIGGAVYNVPRAYSLLHLWGFYENGLKREILRLKDGDFFVDVGANYGAYTVMAAKRGAKVLAIEPGDCSLLQANVLDNGVAHRVSVANVAAWSKADFLHLSYAKNPGMRSIGDEGEVVLGRPLDDMVDGLKPSLVKVDAEDSEYSVFQGMVKTIGKYHPRIVYEARSILLAERSETFLERFGYRFERLDWENWLAYPS